MSGNPVAASATNNVKRSVPFGSRGPAPEGQFYPCIFEAFPPLTAALEGRVDFAYQDVRDLVTTGAGILIDPASRAIGADFPWQIDGRAATSDEVTAQWGLVKKNTDPKLKSLGARNLPGNTMRLPASAVDALTQSRARKNAAWHIRVFANSLKWPADAQLGLLGVSWGTGGGIETVSYMAPFVDAVKADDFDAMTRTSTWGNINADRRTLLVRLFQNAKFVEQQGGDYATLNWPVTLSATTIAVGGRAC